MGEAMRRRLIADQPRREVPHDPDIEVTMTGADEFRCFMIRLGEVRTYLHATALIDLRHKLDEAYLDWLFDNTTSVLAARGVTLDETLAVVAEKNAAPETKKGEPP
jgi:hypothetical protein